MSTMTAIVEQVRDSDQKALLKKVKVKDGKAVDSTTGEPVPGLTVTPGGQPRSLSIREEPELIESAGAEAAALVATLAAVLEETPGADEVPDEH